MTALFNNNKLDSEDFYKSPNGYIVFTEKYHLKRVIVVKADVNIVHTATTKRQDYSKRIKRNEGFSEQYFRRHSCPNPIQAGV